MKYQELFNFFGREYRKVELMDGWAIYPSFAAFGPVPEWMSEVRAEEERMPGVSLAILVAMNTKAGTLLRCTPTGIYTITDKNGHFVLVRQMRENVFIREDYYQLSLTLDVKEWVLSNNRIIGFNAARNPVVMIGRITGLFDKMDLFIKDKEKKNESRGKTRRSPVRRTRSKDGKATS